MTSSLFTLMRVYVWVTKMECRVYTAVMKKDVRRWGINANEKEREGIFEDGDNHSRAGFTRKLVCHPALSKRQLTCSFKNYIKYFCSSVLINPPTSTLYRLNKIFKKNLRHEIEDRFFKTRFVKNLKIRVTYRFIHFRLRPIWWCNLFCHSSLYFIKNRIWNWPVFYSLCAYSLELLIIFWNTFSLVYEYILECALQHINLVTVNIDRKRWLGDDEAI